MSGDGLSLVVAPLGQLSGLKPATYVVNYGDEKKCALKARGPGLPSAAATYAYLAKRYGGRAKVIAIVPESLAVELKEMPNDYAGLRGSLASKVREEIGDAIGNTEDECGALGEMPNDLDVRVVPLRGTFIVRQPQNSPAPRAKINRVEVSANMYDTQALAAYEVASALLSYLNGAVKEGGEGPSVRLYVDVTNAPNQLQVMTARAAEGAAAALSLVADVKFGVSALDPFISEGQELTLNVIEEGVRPGIRLPQKGSRYNYALVGPHKDDESVRRAVTYYIGAAAAIDAGAIFLAPLLASVAEGLLDGKGDTGPLGLAKRYVDLYVKNTEVSVKEGTLIISRQLRAGPALETLSYFSLAHSLVKELRMDRNCIPLEEIKDVSRELLEKRGLASAVAAFNESNHYISKYGSLTKESCLYKLLRHKPHGLDDRQSARDLMAHGGFLENIVRLRKDNSKRLLACPDSSCLEGGSGLTDDSKLMGKLLDLVLRIKESCLYKLLRHKPHGLDDRQSARDLMAHGGFLENIVRLRKDNSKRLLACPDSSCLEGGSGLTDDSKFMDKLLDLVLKAAGVK